MDWIFLEMSHKIVANSIVKLQNTIQIIFTLTLIKDSTTLTFFFSNTLLKFYRKFGISIYIQIYEIHLTFIFQLL